MIELGGHRLHCGDLTAGACAEVLKGEKADIVYTDPPWGIGALKYFDTVNQKMTGAKKAGATWEGFCGNLAAEIELHTHETSRVVIEMGPRFYPDIIRSMEANTKFSLRQLISTVYRGASDFLPMKVMLFGIDSTIPITERQVWGTHGDATVISVLSQLRGPGKIVLDPCTGFGRTLKIADKFGMKFRGVEINSARMARAAKYLRKKYAAK